MANDEIGTEGLAGLTGALRIPASTYRLQFNRFLPFGRARKIVPYLHELGITDVYSSPNFRSVPGSLHGYDIIRYDQLNPEAGTLEEYELFTDELSRHGMGQVQDIVPNHMCILGDNPWWQSVLENGRSSPYAHFFDIDWYPPLETLKDKVLLPILGEQYGKALEMGEIRLNFGEGGFFLSCYENTLPVEPGSYELILRHRLGELERKISETGQYEELMSVITALGHLPGTSERDLEKNRERNREKEVIKRRLWALYEASPDVREFIDGNIEIFNGVRGDPRSFDLLDGLISRQPYRLSFWVVATDEINYRRFFDINQLAAIRPELPDVFDESHRLIFEFIRQGRITGLRVDHLDGLYNPAEYLRDLQEDAVLAGLPGQEAQDRKKSSLKAELLQRPPAVPFYIIGEKILLKGEKIPDEWPICGTTGYDFLNSLNGIFIRTESARQMDDIYFRFTGSKLNFADLVYSAKKQVMDSSMSGEVNVLGHRLYMLAQKSRSTRDFTLLSLTRALSEVMACFQVYRTYISSSGAGERDRRYIEQAVKKAQRLNTSISAQTFDYIKQVLVLEYGADLSADDKAEWFDFVMKLQQLTGPIMAKGLEDTAFYIYNRLLSLNEVGGSPDRFGLPMEGFHGQNMERSKFRPCSMTATSTHDTKRSEDVRARLNVLTEMPRAWREALLKWKRTNRKKKPVLDRPVPGANDEYHLYQVLLGIWPVEGGGHEGESEKFAERIRQYTLKAAREAKVNTSWINPDKDYENALLSFIDRILFPMDRNKNPFLRDFVPFAEMVSCYGLLNSLSQVLLKAASPGIPDFYQGTELWTFSLVDPDNRGDVDYEARMLLLDELRDMEASMGKPLLCARMLEKPADPRVKLYVTWKALRFRKALREVFIGGDYVAVEPEGAKKEHLCAFLRKSGAKTALVCAPRFFSGLVPPGGLPIGEALWKDTWIELPALAGPLLSFRDVFTDRVVEPSVENGRRFIRAGELFSAFPLFLAEGFFKKIPG